MEFGFRIYSCILKNQFIVSLVIALITLVIDLQGDSSHITILVFKQSNQAMFDQFM